MNKKKILKALGYNLRKIRQKKSLSQEGLALMAGLDRTYLSGIERGERNPGVFNLFKIANALNVPAHHLLKFKVEDYDGEEISK